MRRNNIRWASLFLAAALLLAGRTGAQPATRPSAPATQPKGDYDVTDWVVLVVDANVPLASAQSLFKSTLPSFAESRRPAAEDASADANGPAPFGLIRFTGAAAADDPRQKIDVLVEAKGGRFLARWPRARSSGDRELWKDVRLTRDDAGAQPIEANHWLAALRKPADSAWVNAGGRAEKFLLYDAEVAYPNPLKIESAPGGAYQASDAGAHPLHDLQLYKPNGNGWRTGGVDRLNPATGAPAAPTPTAPPAAQPAPASDDAAAKAALDEAERQKAAAPATPPAAPTTQPAASNTAKIAIGTETLPDAAAALAPWRQRLASLGLPPADVEAILAILARHALAKDHLTAVYRMDPAELDNTLKLEIVPEPRRLTRVALVIARNIDPAIVEQLDVLIAQLGAPEWSKREAAQKQLAAVGALAKPKLEAAVSNKDLEIAWRAERLLAALNNPNAPQPPGR